MNETIDLVHIDVVFVGEYADVVEGVLRGDVASFDDDWFQREQTERVLRRDRLEAESRKKVELKERQRAYIEAALF